MTKFYKTIIQITVISDNGPKVQNLTLTDIAYEMIQGELAGSWEITKHNAISSKQCAKELMKMNCEPDFMGLDDKGNEI